MGDECEGSWWQVKKWETPSVLEGRCCMFYRVIPHSYLGTPDRFTSMIPPPAARSSRLCSKVGPRSLLFVRD